ncbi:MAG TPA: sigma-70 factor domain-containing protein [Mucilaginibacter sp.]|jgi:RNA polymerase primary sigma factor
MRQLQITQSITNREVRSLETYLNDLSKVRLIGLDEEVALAQKIRQGTRSRWSGWSAQIPTHGHALVRPD